MSDAFAYRDDLLHCEDLALSTLAERHGTPLYVYSRATIAARMATLRDAFGPETEICYAVKANSNLSLLRLLASLGAGFDVVSSGELLRLRAAGVPTERAVFAGVAKQRDEIELALRLGIRTFHVESPHELPWLAAAAAAHGTKARVALRMNPDVDPATHRHISTGKKENKFGLTFDVAAQLVAEIAASPHLQLVGYQFHLGSQLTSPKPYVDAFDRVAEFVDADPRRGDGVETFDFGGGFGVPYRAGDKQLDLTELAATLQAKLRPRGWRAVIEPGRFLVAEAGILLTRVIGTKGSDAKRFVLVDAAMNDLMRPALYDAWHDVVPVRRNGSARPVSVDVVGPVCESSDFLAKDRVMPLPHQGDLLAVLGAGAYGASMASQYNSRRRPAEILVDGSTATVIRRRETHEELWAAELPTPHGNEGDDATS